MPRKRKPGDVSDIDRLIAAYKAAYLAANDSEVRVEYRRGWFSIGSPGLKMRRNRFILATETLRFRACDKP